MKKETKKVPGGWIAAFKFVPLIVFALLVIVFKMGLLMAAPIATFCAIAVYMIINKTKFEVAFDQGLAASKKIISVLFILMFAYGTANCIMTTGVGASLINLALELGVTARTVALVSLLVTCLLSTATGTSWGTFAACAPIFLWLTAVVGGDVMLTVCCIAGGSCFGDNIGMISDVTVLSCGMQDVKIIDRLKHQGIWALGCLVIASSIILAVSWSLPNTPVDVDTEVAQIVDSLIKGEEETAEDSALTTEAAAEEAAEEEEEKLDDGVLALLTQVKEGQPYYLIIPVVVIIGLSFLGLHTMICLGAGMVSSLILGMIADNITMSEWFALLEGGFGEAGSWVIVMMLWVSAFGGIMNSMNAFDPLAKLIVRISKNVQQLMGWCGVMCLAGNVALADEAAQVTTISPIIRGAVENNVECEDEKAAYTLRLRLATFTSAMGIYGSQLIPWHCFPVYFAGIATVVYPDVVFQPTDIISQNYMGFIVVGSALLLTFTGLDRFVPGFRLPGSDRARLSKSDTVKAK